MARTSAHDSPICIAPSQSAVYSARVPPEIWIEVFTRSLPGSHEYLETRPCNITLADPVLAPMALASVCHVWRNIACNDPELWDMCWLSYKHPELNHIWLSRTGTRLLSLYGRSPPDQETRHKWSESDLAQMSNAFLRSIIPYRTRWKIVVIDTSPFHGLPFLNKDTSFSLYPYSDAPELKTLEIGCPRFMRLSSTWVHRLVHSAPSLRVLKLFSVSCTKLGLHTFPRLDDLQLYNISIGDALIMLGSLPLLQRFTVSTNYEGHGINTLPHVIHDSLSHLHIEGPVNDFGECILDYLTLPSLQSFRTNECTADKFLGLLDRSQCHIVELKSLGTWHGDDVVSAAVLGHEAVDFWLESLEISGYELDVPLLEGLRYTPEAPHLINLEQLSLINCTYFNLEEGQLAEVISSRCGASLRNYGTWDSSPGLIREVRLRYFYGKFTIHDNSFLEGELPYILPLSKPRNRKDKTWGGELVWKCQAERGCHDMVVKSVRFSLGEPESRTYSED